MRYVSRSLEETRDFASHLLSLLCERALPDRATVLTLSGELGSGKTTLTGFLATHLGVSGPVTSPTFVLRCDYDTTDGVFSRLVHIDAYRLSSTEELPPIGFSEVLSSPKTLVVLEWPERVASAVPEEVCAVTAEAIDTTYTFSVSCV